ncbi:Putative peptidoglycan binding domain-containing protein [Streptomyces sp. WMMB 714]|uniref:peptidoglycan recognition protein family protein n=1 Tax=Streptomyces sp. WMMB 714 TaxID=1286822 RepID=UPI0005F863A0|nr:N-acetylmuramoyl-L-alanine amidase [Streptomyces sp. WMMB 714]SCK53080.1 Putative peptidoglycan binding domain-containing protein [Streptomyces sp. WMMB 714]
MAPQPGFDRRSLLRGGAAATAASAIGLGAAGTAHAAGPAAAPAGSRSAARAKVAEPRIYSTEEWGARAPSSAIVVEDHRPTFIVVHHTAEPGNSEDYSLEHAKKICRDIQNFHMDGNGWSDSGQQFTNSRGGFRLEGRHRSLEVVRGGTQHVQGANVGNHNSEVIGIENEGLYTEVDVPQALWDSLVQLVAWIAAQYGTDLANIKGHRDFNSTECPGEVLYGRLQELRDAVGNALGLSSSLGELLNWPLLKPGSVGPQVRAAQHLLRAKGYSVPVDGIFGTSTKRAVAELADTHNIDRHTCSAMHHSKVDETGFLGSDIWPLLTPGDRRPEGGEIEEAVGTLLRSKRGKAPDVGELTETAWKRLLN